MNYTAKSIILDCADNYGNSTYIGIRQVDFWFEGAKITNVSADFTAYGNDFPYNYYPRYAFDTTTTKTGSSSDNAWVSEDDNKRQRLICVFDSGITFDEIRVNNYHSNGSSTSTEVGVQNVKIHISTDAITDITYDADIANSYLIYDDVFDRHISSNVEDEQILVLTPPTPVLSIDAATNISQSSATLNGSVDDMGMESSLDLSFEYGETTSYGSETSTSTLTAVDSFSKNITGLSDNTNYHFRVKATNGVDTWYSADASFESLIVTVWGVERGGGAWSFEKCPPKPRYNVGHKIATNTDPTWDTYDFTGIPITDGHKPCGYWQGVYIDTEPPFHFEIVTQTGLEGERITWGPVERSPINGCFVKTRSLNIYSSDDGGITWTYRLNTSAASGADSELTYKNGMFIAFRAQIIYYSVDAITWNSVDLSTFYVNVSGVYSVDYNEHWGKFVLPISVTGTTVRRVMYGSSDLSFFEYKSYSFNSHNSLTGNKAFQRYHYLGASNYSDFWRSPSLSGINNDWVALSSVGASDKENMATDGNILLFGNRYSFDGTTWATTNMIDYDSTSDLIYSYNSRLGFICRTVEYISSGAGSRVDIHHSRNGLDWTVSYSEMNLSASDLAIGINGYVVVGTSGTLVMKKVSDEAVIIRDKWISGKQRWSSYQGQTPWTL